IIAAVFNLGMIIPDLSEFILLFFRFSTGFFLAGIYPVGMKIASDYEEKGLGKSLGFLVGALVLGTAFPHLLKSVSYGFSWQYVIISTSLLSAIGGCLVILMVPDGPFRKIAQKLKWSAFFTGFKNFHFRSAAFGYFGHMWELYAFWAFVPVMLLNYQHHFPQHHFSISLFSFLIIASGSISCAIAGIISQKFGVKKIASLALISSGICCLLSPIFLSGSSLFALIIFLFLWGIFVVADSPLFSTLVAQNAPQEIKGTSLIFVNCIGFAITILSIQLLRIIIELLGSEYAFMILAIGPALGLVALLKKHKNLA
ncbi:MAG: MFS transporter, partial [Pelobium sp.]